jgi:hypothetical protein
MRKWLRHCKRVVPKDEPLYDHVKGHNVKEWLLHCAKEEDACTIGLAVSRIPSWRLHRELARIFSAACALLLLLSLANPAFAGGLPDPDLTPGAIRDDIGIKALCTTKWGLDHRALTTAMKREVMDLYKMTPQQCPSRKIEIDHLISRELLGKDAVENAWPQCYEKPVAGLKPSETAEWGAHKKDRLENALHKEVCAVPLADRAQALADAQNEISTDWIEAYRKRFGEPKAR